MVRVTGGARVAAWPECWYLVARYPREPAVRGQNALGQRGTDPLSHFMDPVTGGFGGTAEGLSFLKQKGGGSRKHALKPTSHCR